MSSGSSGGGSVQNQSVQPYEAARPALNQILSESGNLYNQGVSAAGYVAPSTQTTSGLAQQEVMANAANTQLADTLGGNYLNPFLSPMLQGAANDIATSVNSEFSAAGRSPGSMMNQQQILGGITDAALPYAFDQYDKERSRQLAIAGSAPNLTQVGGQLENIQRQQNMAPFQALQQYNSIVNPIATGLPVQQSSTQTQANPLTSAMGGALIGSKFGTTGAMIGGGLGFLGGLL
jgi:hypothetical protein|tara:strand:+ start:141 stop:842 length:702 start_codon:yes stop_codon:yes gene_type:complete